MKDFSRLAGGLRTFSLLLDLQRDRLSRLLQQADGFAQRFPLQTAAVDGQNTISDVDRTGPATRDYSKHTEKQHRQTDGVRAPCRKSWKKFTHNNTIKKPNKA